MMAVIFLARSSDPILRSKFFRAKTRFSEFLIWNLCSCFIILSIPLDCISSCINAIACSKFPSKTLLLCLYIAEAAAVEDAHYSMVRTNTKPKEEKSIFKKKKKQNICVCSVLVCEYYLKNKIEHTCSLYEYYFNYYPFSLVHDSHRLPN